MGSYWNGLDSYNLGPLVSLSFAKCMKAAVDRQHELNGNGPGIKGTSPGIEGNGLSLSINIKVCVRQPLMSLSCYTNSPTDC